MQKKTKGAKGGRVAITFTGMTKDEFRNAGLRTGRGKKVRCYFCKRLEGSETVLLDSDGSAHFAPIEMRQVKHEFGNGSLAAYHICLECAMLLWNPRWK